MLLANLNDFCTHFIKVLLIYSPSARTNTQDIYADIRLTFLFGIVDGFLKKLFHFKTKRRIGKC